MVAKTPPKHKKMVAPPPPLNPTLLRETVKKVDRCMARLQELQYTVSGGTKVISGVNLSPRSTRGYLRTSIRCKQETLRMKNSAARKSPVGKLQGNLGGEWQRMSLPAMLVGETVGEILQASQFAREVVEAVAASKTKRTVCDDPKTPVSKRRSPNSKVHYENTELKARRKREKQVVLQLIRSESSPPSLQRARSRINFKVSPKKREVGKENWFVANRVSPKNKPWAKKTVLFPNPLFLSSPSQQHKSSKTKSPVMTKTRQTPHKFLIKSPSSNSKFQVKIRNAPVSLSPTRPAILNKRSPKKSPKMSTASKLRRSFSPSRLANRFVSPLKNRMSSQQKSSAFMSGLKQRPSSSPMRFSGWKL